MRDTVYVGGSGVVYPFILYPGIGVLRYPVLHILSYYFTQGVSKLDLSVSQEM